MMVKVAQFLRNCLTGNVRCTVAKPHLSVAITRQIRFYSSVRDPFTGHRSSTDSLTIFTCNSEKRRVHGMQ